jgi:phosphoribosylaminoimidazole carboxylase PurE protein
MPNETARKPRVGIVMGSDSDLAVMAECCKVLDALEVGYEVRVLSAHRTPEPAARYAQEAVGRGLSVIVAGAGGAAHLAGAMAANTTLPVIAVPVDSTPLAGFDALLSSVQMPPGVPVACVAVGKMGAANAGHLAAQVLALADEDLARRVAESRKRQGQRVAEADANVAAKLRELLSR